MNQKKIVLRGEAALVIAVIINSLGVLLMLQSGSGISAISSVPYAFHQVMPKLSLGTWKRALRSSETGSTGRSALYRFYSRNAWRQEKLKKAKKHGYVLTK